MQGGVADRCQYLNAHLHVLSNQNTSPWSNLHSSTTSFAVENYRRFWQLGPVFGIHWGVVDDQMWAVMDWHTTL